MPSAKEAGIIEDEKTELALTHDEMEQMTDDELKEVLPKLRVVSRAKPLDKKRTGNTGAGKRR